MSRTCTSKPSTTSRGRGRGVGTSNTGRGTVIKRGGGTAGVPRLPTLVRPTVPTSIPNGRARGVSNANRGSPTRLRRGRGAMAAGSTNTPFDRQGQGLHNVDGNNVNDSNNKPDVSNQPTGGAGYTIVSPNEKKRREITQQAQKNLEAYENYKEKNRLQHVSYVGTAGGGLVTEQEARLKAARENSTAAYNSRLKREAFRNAEKQKEEDANTERKMAARRQAEQNAERAKKEEDRKRETHKDEMRRKNAAFLDRLEASNTSGSRNQTSQSSEPKKQQSYEQQRHNPLPQPATAFSDTPVPAQPSVVENSNESEDLTRLQMMFPFYTRNDLEELYSQMGSLELTVDILSE